MRIKERFLKITAQQIFGNAQTCGIATVTSGTAVASVAATGVKSGNVIMLQPLQYAPSLDVSSGNSFFFGVMPMSVRTGAFEIACVGSRCPVGTMPVAWTIIHRS